ncbi:MAG: ABC transporter permease subunit, partial [Nitrospiraceae bacterium]|nr:ABC transporter permease subunit [Nitrospiraceae bacterium]
IRNILGQVRNRIDARFMMDNRRIFVANLSKGKLGADKANLLGSVIVTKLYLAALEGVPKDYIEAAQLDGAGNWEIMKSIRFPLISPSAAIRTR